MLRLLAAVSGGLASLIGGAALVHLLFVPVYRGTGCLTLPGQSPTCEAAYSTLFNGSDPSTHVEVALVSVLVIGVGLSALWHARTGRPIALTVLVALTGALAIWTTCPLLLPGMLLPGGVLSAVACTAAAFHPSGAAP